MTDSNHCEGPRWFLGGNILSESKLSPLSLIIPAEFSSDGSTKLWSSLKTDETFMHVLLKISQNTIRQRIHID